MRLSLPMLSVAATAVLLTACSSVPYGPSKSHKADNQSPRAMQRCDTTRAQWAVGKTNTEHNINEARQRAGAYMARVLRPGQPTTREFNAERLNLEVDATGRIVAARCG